MLAIVFEGLPKLMIKDRSVRVNYSLLGTQLVENIIFKLRQ
jgi:hypothetical protein